MVRPLSQRGKEERITGWKKRVLIFNFHYFVDSRYDEWATLEEDHFLVLKQVKLFVAHSMSIKLSQMLMVQFRAK